MTSATRRSNLEGGVVELSRQGRRGERPALYLRTRFGLPGVGVVSLQIIERELMIRPGGRCRRTSARIVGWSVFYLHLGL